MFKSLRVRLSMMILVLVILISSVLGIMLYGKATGSLEDELGQRLVNLAQVSTMLIDSNKHELLKTGDENSETYLQIRNILREAAKKYNAAYVYTLRKKDAQTTAFVIDTDEENPGLIGEEYEMTKAMELAFNGTANYDRDMYTDQWGTFKSGYAPILDSTGKVVAILGIDYDAKQVLALKKDFLFRILIPILIGVVLCLCFGIWGTKKATDTIDTTGKNLKTMSQEMTGNIQNTNEIGQAIVAAMNQLSTGSEEQAHNLENVRSKIEHFNGSLEEIINHAENSSDSSSHVVTVAEEGRSLMQSAGDKMNGIKMSVNALAEAVEDLDAYSEKIKGIVVVIAGFAERTKILALNATIEAARAGETGKGFAVVAGEVSKLANKSEEAAKEIDGLIFKVREKVMGIVETVQQSKSHVDQGTNAFFQTENALKQIVSDSQKAAILVQEIVEKVDREKGQTQEVTQLVQNVAALAQQVAASTQEVSASIVDQSTQLKEIVENAKGLKRISTELSLMI